MKKICLMLLGGAVFFAAACANNQVPDKKPGAGAQIKGEAASENNIGETAMDWSGMYCGKKEPEVITVDDRAGWEGVWKTISEKPAPEVDFSKYVVIAVFAGEKNTGGYSVEFLEPVTRDGKKVIPYRIKSPGESLFTVQSLTQPYHLRAFERGSLPVEPEEVK